MTIASIDTEYCAIPFDHAPSRREASAQAARAIARYRIRGAARAVFSERGYAATTVGEIGASAGFAKSAVFRYFDSKADLFIASLCYSRESFSTLIADHLPRALSPPDQIRWLARMYLKHWRSHGYGFQIFWALDNLADKLPERRVESFLACCRIGLQVVKEAIEDGVQNGDFAACEPEEVAHIFWCLANALLVGPDGVTLRGDFMHDDFEPHFLSHIDTLLRGLEADTAGIADSGRCEGQPASNPPYPAYGEFAEERVSAN